MPQLPHFDVVVKQALQVTPRTRRLVVDASAIKDCVRGLPAEWLKVVVPGGDTGREPAARAYTIRSFDRSSGELALDFVLHGDAGRARDAGDVGGVGAWAARAREGDAFAITAPHPRSVYAVDATPRPYLLFGDETAVPAIATILRALPRGASARVVLEVEDAAEEQPLDSGADVSLRWVRRRDAAGSSLTRVARDIALPQAHLGQIAIWAAGEASAVRVIRDHFREAGVAPARIHAAGYWKKGAADFRDEDA